MAKRPIEKLSPAKPARWKIVRLTSTPAADVGTVEGPEDAAAAVEEAIKKYKITNPEKRKKLAAFRVR